MLKECNYTISGLVQRKEMLKYYIDLKKIDIANKELNEKKLNVITEDLDDDVYFPSLHEVAEKIKRNETLELPRKRAIADLTNEIILDNNYKKKKIIEQDGKVFIAYEMPNNTVLKTENN